MCCKGARERIQAGLAEAPAGARTAGLLCLRELPEDTRGVRRTQTLSPVRIVRASYLTYSWLAVSARTPRTLPEDSRGVRRVTVRRRPTSDHVGLQAMCSTLRGSCISLLVSVTPHSSWSLISEGLAEASALDNQTHSVHASRSGWGPTGAGVEEERVPRVPASLLRRPDPSAGLRRVAVARSGL